MIKLLIRYNRLKSIFCFLIAVILLLQFTACTKTPVTYSGFAMDSAYSLTLYTDNSTAKNLELEISKKVKQGELLLSAFDENSAVYKLNKNRSITLNEAKEICDIINVCSEVSGLCDGRYSVVCGAVTRLWNIGNDTYIPSFEEAVEASKLCKSDAVSISNDSIFLNTDGALLDFGSVGKGFACDKAFEILEKFDISSAVVSFGGSILTYKTKGNETWSIDIRSPFDNSNAGRLNINGTSFISTSGGYERFFEKDGQTFHHIFDLEDGMPSNSDLASVTVISQSGVLSDALSTACFIVGAEKSKAILDNYENTSAVFIKNDGSIYTYKSKDIFTANSGFTVKGEL